MNFRFVASTLTTTSTAGTPVTAGNAQLSQTPVVSLSVGGPGSQTPAAPAGQVATAGQQAPATVNSTETNNTEISAQAGLGDNSQDNNETMDVSQDTESMVTSNTTTPNKETSEDAKKEVAKAEQEEEAAILENQLQLAVEVHT